MVKKQVILYNVSYSLGQYLERPVVQVMSHKVEEEEFGWRKILEELVDFLLEIHFALSYAALKLLLNRGRYGENFNIIDG